MYIAILVFITITLIVFCCKRDYKIDKIMIVSLMIILTLVAGFRYDVGIDYLSYQNHFYNQTFPDNTEFLYWLICKLTYVFNMEFYMVTLFMAVIQNIFIYLGLKKRDLPASYILLGLLIYISDVWLVSFNLMRQSVAVAIFFYASIYIEKRDIKRYMIYVLMAMGFHKSSYLLMPIYFIKYIDLNIIRYLLLLIICYTIVGTNSAQEILNWLALNFKGYERYYNSRLIFAGDSNIFSIGVLGKVIISIIIVFMANKKINKEKKIEFNLYLYGRLFNILSISSFIFDRIGIYFSIFSIYAIPYGLSKVDDKDKKYFIGIIIIILLLILYLKSTSASSFNNSSKIFYKSIFNIY